MLFGVVYAPHTMEYNNKRPGLSDRSSVRSDLFVLFTYGWIALNCAQPKNYRSWKTGLNACM